MTAKLWILRRHDRPMLWKLTELASSAVVLLCVALATRHVPFEFSGIVVFLGIKLYGGLSHWLRYQRITEQELKDLVGGPE